MWRALAKRGPNNSLADYSSASHAIAQNHGSVNPDLRFGAVCGRKAFIIFQQLIVTSLHDITSLTSKEVRNIAAGTDWDSMEKQYNVYRYEFRSVRAFISICANRRVGIHFIHTPGDTMEESIDAILDKEINIPLMEKFYKSGMKRNGNAFRFLLYRVTHHRLPGTFKNISDTLYNKLLERKPT